jgi:hypothetical protein
MGFKSLWRSLTMGKDQVSYLQPSSLPQSIPAVKLFTLSVYHCTVVTPVSLYHILL